MYNNNVAVEKKTPLINFVFVMADATIGIFAHDQTTAREELFDRHDEFRPEDILDVVVIPT